MLFKQAVYAVLDLVTINCYVPWVMVIHVGQSDFGDMAQHLDKFYTEQMTQTICQIIMKAQKFCHAFISVFVSFMLPQQWYVGWRSQKAALKCHVRFNGCLAHAAMSADQYMVNHPKFSPKDHTTFLKSGSTDLSLTGNLIFLVDIQNAIHRADPFYKALSLPEVHQHLGNDHMLQQLNTPTRKVAVKVGSLPTTSTWNVVLFSVASQHVITANCFVLPVIVHWPTGIIQV